MARKRRIIAVPNFFGLPESKRISFKVPNKNSNSKTLNDGTSFPRDAIEPREDFVDVFFVNEKSTKGRPRILTPEQQYNYKSNFKRYEKGRKLIEDGYPLPDPSDPNKFKFPSNNSPKGYWEVKKEDNPNPPVVDFTYELNLIPFVYLTELSTQPLNLIYKGGSLEPTYPGEEPNYVPQGSLEQEDYNFPGGIYTKTGEWNYSADKNVFTASAGYSISLDGLPNFPDDIQFINAEINEGIGVISNIEIEYIEAEMTFNVLQGFDDEDIFENFYGIDASLQGETSDEQSGTLTATIDGINSSFIPFRLFAGGQIRLTNEVKNASIEISLEITITKIKFVDGTEWNEPDEGEGGEGEEWKCDCPDSSKKKEPPPNKLGDDEPQDWTDSEDAGAEDGICKHIWAVRIYLGEDYEVPTDVPIESTPFPGNVEPKIISNNSSFSKWQPGKQRRGGDKF